MKKLGTEDTQSFATEHPGLKQGLASGLQWYRLHLVFDSWPERLRDKRAGDRKSILTLQGAHIARNDAEL